MIDYIYTAKNTATGEIVKASVKADSPQAAAKLLSQQDLFALDITTRSDSDIMQRLGLSGRISSKERVMFTRQLSTLIDAGLPLSKSLRSVQDQIKNQKFKDLLGNVVASVEGGSTLSSAFAQHPKVFNQIYISLVAAGETSGTLDKALLRLATQQEKDAAIASKIRSAMIYPLIVLVLIVAVVVLMLVTVVPQVAQLYVDLKKELPLPTRVLLAISYIFSHFWWALLIGLIPGYFGLKSLLANEKVRYAFDKFKLHTILFGVLFKKVYMARFARTMNTLLASGIPMLQAMETTRNAIGNRLIAADIDKAIDKVRGGKALSESLESSPNFLVLVPQMIKIGEESGEIDNMLGRTATYYEDEVDEAIKNLSTTLEPVMMVVMGGIVGLVIAAVLGPVYSLVGSGAIN